MDSLFHKNKKYFHEVCHGHYGRKIIIGKRASIKDAQQAIEELERALPIHNQNRREMDYLYHYVSGDQPILYRQKDVRPEINNKIVENHAWEITRFSIAQNYGEPIQYVSIGDSQEISDEVEKLNRFMKVRSKDYHDVVMGDWQSSCGTSYKDVWSLKRDAVDDGEPMFDIESPDPRYNFIIYSKAKGHPPLMSVTIQLDDNEKTVYLCTTKTAVYKIQDGKCIEIGLNGHERIRLIEFPNNPRRLSDIELVITLWDGVNKVQSNRIDGVEQFVQSFIKFVNCEIDESTFLKMCKVGALKVKTVNPSMPADVNSVANELDQQQSQTLKDDMYKSALTVLGIPGREQNTGGDTGQAVYLRNGWDFAEQRAKIDEPVTKRSEREFLKVVLSILKKKRQISKNLTIADIDIKVTRNKTDNMLVKAQALIYMLEKGIHPKIAIQTCDLWGDPEKVFIQSKPYLDAKYKVSDEDMTVQMQKVEMFVKMLDAGFSPEEAGKRAGFDEVKSSKNPNFKKWDYGDEDV